MKKVADPKCRCNDLQKHFATLCKMCLQKTAPSCKIPEYARASGNQTMFYTIEDKNNHLILIDGGWTSDAGQVWKVIEEHNTIVDLWIITHPDHMGAFCQDGRETDRTMGRQTESRLYPNVLYYATAPNIIRLR